MRRRLPALALIASGLIAVSACGTRVSTSEQATASSDSSGLGSGLSDLAGSATTAPTTGPTDAATAPGQDSGGVVSATDDPTLPPIDDGGTPGGQTAGGIPNGIGMTATTVKIGAYTAQAFDSVAAAFGASSSTGSQSDMLNAVAAYINKHGGMAGRQVQLVFHDASATASAAQEYANACTAWTQDQKVFSIVSMVGTTDDSLFECLKKHSTTDFSSGDNRDDQSYKNYADTFYSPSDMSITAMLRNVVRSLAAQNFFGKTAKIGVVGVDNDSDRRAIAQGLRPALAAAGLKLDQEFEASTTTSAVTDYSAAVLRFKAAGITHVIFTGLGSPLLFGLDAQQQGYHPRYVMNSLNYPAAFIAKNLGPKQMANSVGIGWHPYSDVNPAQNPGPVSSRATLCKQILKGIVDFNNGESANLAMGACDDLMLLWDTMKVARSYTVAGVRAAVESLTHYESANTFAAGFSPGKLHDGARGYRMFHYVDSCSCFQYYTPVQKVQ